MSIYYAASSKTTYVEVPANGKNITSTRINSNTIEINIPLFFSLSSATGGTWVNGLSFYIDVGDKYYSGKIFGNYTTFIKGATYSTSVNVSIPVNTSGSGSSTYNCYIAEYSPNNYADNAYGSNGSPMTWLGKDYDGSSNIIQINVDWDAYVPPVYGPIAPTLKASSNVYTNGSTVKLSWSGATQGTNPLNKYILYKNNKIYKEYNINTTTAEDIITAKTTYKIVVEDTAGYSSSSKLLTLGIRNANNPASNIRVGKIFSNPGFCIFKNEENISIPIKWSEASPGENNKVIGYKIIIDDFEIDNLIKEKTETEIKINKPNLNKTYSIKVRTYDESGSYVDSDICYLYFIKPSFNVNLGPVGKSAVLLENTFISWGELQIEGIGAELLTKTYNLGYKKETAINQASLNEIEYTLIEKNLTETFYNWQVENINNDELVSLQVTGIVSYQGQILDDQTTIKSAEDKKLFKGELPKKFKEITFSIPQGDYYGTNSPMNINYNVINDSWNLNNSILNFKNSLLIKCTHNEGWEQSANYFDCVKIKWKKGLYTGEKIQKIEKDNNYFKVELREEEAKQLFSQSGDSVRFEIYSLYEIIKNDEGSGIYIYSDGPSLNFDNSPKITINGEVNNYEFTRAATPKMFSNGTIIPSLNSNAIRNVDFFNNQINSISGIGEEGNKIWEMDYRLSDLRADTIASGAPIYGFKIYATKDKQNYIDGRLVDKNYLFQTIEKDGSTELTSVELKDGIFVLSNLIPSGNETADSNTPGFIGFYPQILRDDEYLRRMFFNIEENPPSLQTLRTVETFYYVITAIDILKQESVINYTLEVKYDFRLAATFENGLPELIKNNKFTKYTDNNSRDGYLLYDQTKGEDGLEQDFILFEWYPAFNRNDYLNNENNYIRIEDKEGEIKYYLTPGVTDPNLYTLYKWTENNFYSKRLILDNDYKEIIEKIEDKNGEEIEVKKYIGCYGMNLKNNNNNEYFNLTLIPSYIDEYNEEKAANAIPTLYPIKEKGNTVFFHLSRFVPATLKYEEIIRKNEDNSKTYKPKFKIIDKGILNKNDENFILESSIKISNTSLNNDDKYLIGDGNYSDDLITYTFTKDELALIYDNMPFSAEVITNSKITRFSIETDTTKGYKYSDNSITSTISSILKHYIPADFSTLSLRKNKVGINFSSLEKTEEALYVVAKDRVDSGNNDGNIAVYDGTYPHVFSIQGDKNTIMPQFNRNNGKHNPQAASDYSVYIGFYSVDEKNIPFRMGSFGMEAGYPYFVYKGKYFTEDEVKNDTYENDYGEGKIAKKYDNKDFFEKISLANLPIPIGTTILFPKASLDKEGYNPTDILRNHHNYKTWYVCDGHELTAENDSTLIEILGKKYLPSLGTVTLGNEEFVYIIKGDG